MKFPWQKTEDHVHTIVLAICKSLREEHRAWKHDSRKVDGHTCQCLVHTSDMVLHFNRDEEYWDIWLPHHIPNDTEKDLLRLAVSEWGADQIVREEEPPAMPAPVVETPDREGDEFKQN